MSDSTNASADQKTALETQNKQLVEQVAALSKQIEQLQAIAADHTRKLEYLAVWVNLKPGNNVGNSLPSDPRRTDVGLGPMLNVNSQFR